MGMSRRVVWDRSIEFLLIDLDANYVHQMMLSLSDRDRIEIVPHYKRHDPLINAIGLTIK
jgi:AraC family transcriptional regulator